jgi:hypothetical protein
LLLSKALKLQQDDEDRKNEFVISGLEKKIEELENSLKEKDAFLSSAEGMSRPNLRENPGTNQMIARIKYHTYDDSWYRNECHIFIT